MSVTIYDVDEAGVALLRLDRPKARNAIDTQMLEEMLAHPVTMFCYPNGAYNRIVRDAVARAGYRIAVTSDDGLNDATNDPLALRRIQNEEQDLAHFLVAMGGSQLVQAGTLAQPQGAQDTNLRSQDAFLRAARH